MIDTAFELLSEGFRLLLLASWRALPLLLIAGLISALSRGRLAPRYHALLWSLVICRLLLPISLPSQLSLQGPLERLINSPASADARALPPGGQRPFVTNVEFRGRNALQPVVDVVEERLRIMVQPVVRAGSELELTFELQGSKLKAVEVANLPIRYPDQPNTKVTVQVPLVAETTIGGSVILTEEQSILIAAPQSFDGKHSADSWSSEYVVLTPRIIQP